MTFSRFLFLNHRLGVAHVRRGGIHRLVLSAANWINGFTKIFTGRGANEQ